MAKLLSVVWYKVLPARFGGQKGIAEFNQYLSAYHELYCLCSKNNEPSGNETYDVLPLLPNNKGQIVYPPAWNIINRKIRQLGITHIILEHSYYGLAGVFLKKTLPIKLVVHAHNIESKRFRELGKWWWQILWVLEKYTHRKADLNLFKTSLDLEFAVKNFGLDPERCMVVPFGINKTTAPSNSEKENAGKLIRKKHHIRPDEKILLFSGSLDYEPNATALKTIVHTIIPTLISITGEPFRVIACGRIIFPGYSDLYSLKHEKYIYAGLVEDIDNYFLAADVFINPVTDGGGIKVKMMDALAFNLPVVCTSHSVKGINKRLTGNKLFISEDGDWNNFSRHIPDAWNNSSSIPDQFFEEYHWSRVIRPVAEKIENL